MKPLFSLASIDIGMTFKEWLARYDEDGWISKGKAQASLFKPGPRDAAKPGPHDVKKCGVGGGPGPCEGGAGGGAAAVPPGK